MEAGRRKAKKPARKKPTRKTYHHGDLRRQLIAAAERIIVERGVEGFTLREAARRVGVSPAAPSHHFKDAKELLTEMALLGFRDFREAIAAGDRRSREDTKSSLFHASFAYA